MPENLKCIRQILKNHHEKNEKLESVIDSGRKF